MRDYTDNELLAVPPIKLDDGERNPFHNVADTKQGFDLSRRWAMLHWPECFSQQTAESDPFLAMEQSLSLKYSGWHMAENAEKGTTAFYPQTAKNVPDWEQRSMAMHDKQKPIVPDAKPQESGIQGKRRGIVRGD